MNNTVFACAAAAECRPACLSVHSVALTRGDGRETMLSLLTNDRPRPPGRCVFAASSDVDLVMRGFTILRIYRGISTNGVIRC